MRFYITADGNWGDASDLVFLHTEEMDERSWELYHEMLNGNDAVELYNYVNGDK